MRHVFGVLAASALIGSVTACTSAAGMSWLPATDSAPITITIVSGSDTSVSPGNAPAPGDVDSGMYWQLVNYWNAYETPANGITVHLDVVPGGATAEHSEMLAAAQGGGQRYDIYNLDNQWVSEFAYDHYIQSLQGLVNVASFLTNPLRSAEDASGQLYAVPFTTDVGLLYYRSDLVSAAAVRGLRTFPAIINLARSAMHHPGVTEGYVGQFASYEGLTVNTLEVIWQHDRNAFASDGTIADSAAVERGLQDLVGAFASSETGPPVVPAAELYYQEEQAYQDFATGKAVFMRNWPIYYEILAAGGPGTVPMNDIGFAQLPFPSALGGQDLAIARSSPYPSQALQVIDFMTSAAAERCLYAVGGFPATRADAYTQTTLPAGPVGNHPLCGTKTDASAQNATLGKTILAALKTAIPRPTTPYYTEFTTLLQTQIWDLLSQASGGNDGGVPGAVNNLTAELRAAATGHSP
jgi:multiple sugar transport system substrate-binding protein